MRMKIKLTKTMKILIAIVVLIIAIVSVYSFLKSKKQVVGATIYLDMESGNKTIIISQNEMKNEYNNVYSVSYLQEPKTLKDERKFEATAVAKIRGENVTFTNYLTQDETTREGNTCEENNIMAAILSGVGVHNLGFKYKDNENEYASGAQLAIWEFWNTWVETSGAKENGFEKGSGNGTVTENGLNGETERKKAQQYTTQNLYNVNIYFLKYFTHNNIEISEKQGEAIDNQPNLILIEVLDEEERVIDSEADIKDINLYVETKSNKVYEVVPGEEIEYTVKLYNKSREEQEDLILSSVLSKNVTFVKMVQIVENQEVELKEGTDYNYSEDTRTIKIKINKLNPPTDGANTDEETGESIEYTKMDGREYRITVIANELEAETYNKTITNIVKVQRNNRVIIKQEIKNIITDAALEIKIDELPEKINEKEECVIGLKITNKGLITAENVKVQISIPEEISIRLYKMGLLSETGEEETSIDGTTNNEFEHNYIQIPAQTTLYIKFFGTIKDVDEMKPITINGTVNGEPITWTTKIQDTPRVTAKIDMINKRRLL